MAEAHNFTVDVTIEEFKAHGKIEVSYECVCNFDYNTYGGRLLSDEIYTKYSAKIINSEIYLAGTKSISGELHFDNNRNRWVIDKIYVYVNKKGDRSYSSYTIESDHYEDDAIALMCYEAINTNWTVEFQKKLQKEAMMRLHQWATRWVSDGEEKVVKAKKELEKVQKRLEEMMNV